MINKTYNQALVELEELQRVKKLWAKRHDVWMVIWAVAFFCSPCLLKWADASKVFAWTTFGAFSVGGIWLIIYLINKGYEARTNLYNHPDWYWWQMGQLKTIYEDT